MIRILNTKQIRELDAFTIRDEPVLSIDLMERACRAFAGWFVKYIDPDAKTGIVCGTGNNGGDGLGIARMLQEWGYPVKVWIVKGSVPESDDFKKNLERLQGATAIIPVTSRPDVGLFSETDVLVDALFGSGLSRPVEGIYAEVIRRFNEAKSLKIAVDIPSGLLADHTSSGEIVRAAYTVSFQLPKLAFFLPQSYAFTGAWTVEDIGLSKSFIKNSATSHYLITEKDASRILRPRSRFDHKGTFGHALIVAGSFGKMGAALLASRAALRSGAGLLTVHVPRCGYPILQTALPEAMVSVDPNENIFTSPGEVAKYTVIGIGPGLGQDPQTAEALMSLIKASKKSLVLDADALNILAGNRENLSHLPDGSILTPHPKEFERLAGTWTDDFERLEKQKQLAAKLRSIIILKGAFSSIATPEGEVYFNSTGNPGMATGGTGDILTGMITGLLAQGYTSREAAILGVYLHGLAGDLAVKETGMEAFISSDLVEFLPQAFLRLNMGKNWGYKKF